MKRFVCYDGQRKEMYERLCRRVQTQGLTSVRYVFITMDTERNKMFKHSNSETSSENALPTFDSISASAADDKILGVTEHSASVLHCESHVHKVFFPSLSNRQSCSPPSKKPRTPRRPVLDEETDPQELQEDYEDKIQKCPDTPSHQHL